MKRSALKNETNFITSFANFNIPIDKLFAIEVCKLCLNRQATNHFSA